MNESKDLFEFMLKRVAEVEKKAGLDPPQAFAKWFIELYNQEPLNLHIPDGSGDGKIDAFFSTTTGGEVKHHLLNLKFTKNYQTPAPVGFYDEATRLWQAFSNRDGRAKYLKLVRPELQPYYRKFFGYFDAGIADLAFVCNYRKNEKQADSLKGCDIELLHLDDLLQFMADDIEGAMPHSRRMTLAGIHDVLSPDKKDTEVSTTIVFARLKDFVSYMDNDPYGLLFARNVRLSLGNTEVNKDIARTFSKHPKEFVFSNNGITMTCDKLNHDPNSGELQIDNPRVVNGAQTLHSINNGDEPSIHARVMVRIITIPPPTGGESTLRNTQRRELIDKISIRSNSQNPIKKWNLVANDDFQHEIARYFRKKNIFYERRKNEWRTRKSALRAVGVHQGPGIKELAQLMASYEWEKKELGPATAKVAVGELFEEDTYKLLKKVKPETCYQLYLAASEIEKAIRGLAPKKKYISNMWGHMDLTLFSMVVRALESAGVRWGAPELEKLLDNKESDYDHQWKTMVRRCAEQLWACYRLQSRKYKKSEGSALTLNNYFKTDRYVRRILTASVPFNVREIARRLGSAAS